MKIITLKMFNSYLNSMHQGMHYVQANSKGSIKIVTLHKRNTKTHYLDNYYKVKIDTKIIRSKFNIKEVNQYNT